MAARNEVVRLTLDDAFTSGMAKAAAATALLDRNLNSLSGSAVRSDRDIARSNKSVLQFGKTTERTGSQVDRSGKQIDRLSGRLALLAQAASVLGPALVPLGAPLVTVMAGLTSQLGAVAGSVGVAVLAFKGMGDGLKAVNEYQLEPTAENLQKVREEMEKLGPAGAEFVRYLDSLGPELSSLQMAAREGLLPGVTEGIEELVTMLPRVRSIVSGLAEAMGGLAGDAGADLAGPEWESFFRYLDTQAGPLLTKFGQTVGNFANGFANMLVALNPLTQDFSSGFLAMSESFEQWSATLGSNDSFQGFLDYVQQSGPKAMDFLGSLIEALAAIVSAAAPVGDVVLPILTSMLDTIGALASTDIGTMFFAAAAGMSVYSRAATVVAAANTRMATGAMLSWRNTKMLGAGAGIAALSMTDLDEKMGLSNASMGVMYGQMAGPWGAAIGAGVGLTMDLAASNDSLAASVDSANKMMEKGGTDTQIRRKIRELRTEIEATEDALSEGFFSMSKPKQMFTGLNEVFGVFGHNSDDARASIDELSGSLGSTIPLAELLGGEVGRTGQALQVAAGDARAFSGALAQMAGWLDKRAALRAYQEELKNFGKALENGFQPKNVEGLDRVADGILQVATQIKNPEIRADFMANARKSLLEFAATGPKAKAAVDKVMDQFIKLGLMEPVELEVETAAATAKAAAIQRLMNKFGMTKAEALATLRDRATPAIDDVAAALRMLNGDEAITYITTVRRTRVEGAPGGMGGRPDMTSSAMGDIFNAHQPQIARGGHTRIWAEPETGGEAYIPLRNDYRRPRAKSIAAETVSLLGGQVSWFARGGMVDGGARNNVMWADPSLASLLTGSLRDLNRALKDSEKALDKETSKRDALLSKRDELASGIRGGLGGDIWAGASNPWEAGATSNPTAALNQQFRDAREFTKLIRSLKSKGLDGAALAEVMSSGDLERARMMAELSAKDLRSFETAYNRTQRAIQAAGGAGGNAVYGAQITAQTAELKGLRADVRAVQHAIKEADKSNRNGQRQNSRDVAKGVSSAASKGIRSRPNAGR